METKPIHLGLPVLLHNEGEVTSFLAAKERIENRGDRAGISLKVGAFLYMPPFAINNPEKRAAAIATQERLGLPLLSAQTPIQGENSLTYTSEDVEFFGKEGLLEVAIEQAAALKKLDPHTDLPDFYVDTHQGQCLFIEVNERTSGVFSMNEYQSRRDEIYCALKSRFRELDSQAKAQGLAGMALEIAPTVTMEQTIRGGKDSEPEMMYFPFCDLASLNDLSTNSITFDVAHWSATRSALEYFRRNNDLEGLEFMFKMEGLETEQDYFTKHPSINAYFPSTRTFHVSNRIGIGTHIDPTTEVALKWGSDRMSGGDISREQFSQIFMYAQENRIPIMVEPNYDISSLQTMQFREADAFLENALEGF